MPRLRPGTIVRIKHSIKPHFIGELAIVRRQGSSDVEVLLDVDDLDIGLSRIFARDKLEVVEEPDEEWLRVHSC